jgi:predicted metal-binding protein
MDQLKEKIENAINGRISDWVIIAPSQVVTAPWVRMKCRFGCSGFGQRLCCPPYSPTSEETRQVLDSYHRAILLHQHWQKGYETTQKFNALLVDLERSLFLQGFYKAFAMGSGPCTLCAQCDTSGPCRNAELARPAMEACGIDVFATARAQELPIEVVRTHKQERDLYGLVLVE